MYVDVKIAEALNCRKRDTGSPMKFIKGSDGTGGLIRLSNACAIGGQRNRLSYI